MKTSSKFKFAFPTFIINFNTHRITELGGNKTIGPSDECGFDKLVKSVVDSMKTRRNDYDNESTRRPPCRTKTGK